MTNIHLLVSGKMPGVTREPATPPSIGGKRSRRP